MKTAIFVEGKTELIFVGEMLLKIFEYQNIFLECFHMRSNNTYPTDYAFGSSEANFYFQIINVGGDVNVLSILLKREEQLWNLKFDKIIGLRDMFSADYKKATKHDGINEKINQQFLEGHQLTIKEQAIKPNKISFHFAIMEVETWLLTCYNIFQKMDRRLNTNFIKEKLNIDLEAIDAETTFFHPTKELKAILELIDVKYDKSEHIVNKIVSNLSKNDYESLNSSEKCASFSRFYIALPKAMIQ